MANRTDRRHSRGGSGGNSDQRTPGQKDRDRILYSSAFRRLAGVTQVVGATQGHIFHNRLTHTIQVAQLARRLAERIAIEQKDFLSAHGLEIDADIAEAAGLAHDLGHPPFGHVAEQQLDELVIGTDPDGYEGNAQSFRIITRLSAQGGGHRGLNLCRATLNAVLKYPAYRGEWKKPGKFGAYRSEADDFAFARQGATPERRSLEAQIMDHADAVAYSVHDFDDFYRAGLIPLDDLTANFDGAYTAFASNGKVDREKVEEYRQPLKEWAKLFPGRYTGTYAERTALRAVGSRLLEEFIGKSIV